MAMDQQDDDKQAETEQPASGQGAIRSAFLSRQSQDAGTGGEGETVVAMVRGVYVSQVSRQTTRRRDDAIKGSEETGGTVLRSIYAARTDAVVVRPRRPARAAPAPARKAKAKKARPARKARAKTRPAVKAKARRARTGRATARRRPAKKAARRR